MKITNHLVTQAQNKKIALGAIMQVLEGRADIVLKRERMHDICERCTNPKQGWTGIGKYQNERYNLTTIVCVTCDNAITVYEAEEECCTPLRGDQPNQKAYKRTCADCNRHFTITARTWEKLREQTTHKCKGKSVNLIADKHQEMKGKYFPKG